MQADRQEHLQELAQTMAAHGDRLVRLCFMYLGDYHLAQDAVQDTFIKAARSLDSFRGDSSQETWLTRIAVNTCKDRLRSFWFRRVEGEEALMNLPAQEAEVLPDDTVLLAVYDLPPKYKDVILLYYYQNYSQEEIAKVLKAPLPTVSSRLRRARNLLKTKLKGWYFDED